MLRIRQSAGLVLRSVSASIIFLAGLFLFLRGFGVGGGAESDPHLLPGLLIGTVGLLICASASLVAPPQAGTKLFRNASDVVSCAGFLLCALGFVRLALFPDRSAVGPDSNAIVNALRLRFAVLFGLICFVALVVSRRLRTARNSDHELGP